MEERQTIMDMATRFRKNCRICGEPIGYGEPFYTDAHTTVHLDCFFDYQREGVPQK